MPKHWVKRDINEHGVYEDRPDEFITFDRNFYLPRTIKEKIIQALNANDQQKLFNLLQKEFIYRTGNYTYTHSYKGDRHSKTWEWRYFLVRPVAEMLLFEHMYLFKEIVSVVQQKGELQNTFIDACLKNTEIPKQIFAPLTEANISSIQAEINKLQQHDKSHKAAQHLAQSLSTHLKKNPFSNNPIDHLEFKLSLVDILHRQGEVLDKDPNYRCIFVNMAMILLGFIPNLINVAVTGNFLFFKQTPQQESVGRISSQLVGFNAPNEPSNLMECPETRDPFCESYQQP